MVLLIIFGILTIACGLVFLAGEEKVKAINDFLNATINRVVINTDTFFLQNRVGTGICLILLGALFFFIAYWIFKSHGTTLKIIAG